MAADGDRMARRPRRRAGSRGVVQSACLHEGAHARRRARRNARPRWRGARRWIGNRSSRSVPAGFGRAAIGSSSVRSAIGGRSARLCKAGRTGAGGGRAPRMMGGGPPPPPPGRPGVRPLSEALRMLHQPPAEAEPTKLEAGDSAAHFALAFDEMFAFQLAMGIDRMRAARRTGARMDAPANLTARLLERLPFTPTRAQIRAIDEIGADLARTHPMNRLLMGDVGSGKTLVALWAALRAAESGWQVAMMAPTELLAEQHHRSFTALCGALGVPAALLLGKTPPAERARTLRLLASGAIPLVFGTHALIQEGVALRSLGLAVIDEQHRFGVFDRARLKALGPSAHVLLMTATPIPRSLALTLLANLDISALDEMPPGRTPILTEIV